MKSILLVDAGAPWVRSLFSAMTAEAEIHGLTIRSGLRFGLPRPWQRGRDGIWQKPLLVPGWTQFPRLSTARLRAAVKKAIAKFNVDFLVYTLPFYAGVAEGFAGKIPQVYYAHDPFRFYDWDVATTAALESRMLGACDLTFAISQALAQDLREVSRRPVVYSPNAVSSDFLKKLESGGPPAEELQGLPRPIVGCVGQINRSYDWPLIARLAEGIPDATFVFVGPIFEEPPDVQRPMKEAFARPNIKWLGPKPHARLPEFLRGFDICFNPLAITEHSNRRSPLRLYDYLATDRPIVSTAIGEASAHKGLVQTFAGAEDGIALLRQTLAGKRPVDLPARSRYIRANTWESRALEVSRQLELLQQRRL